MFALEQEFGFYTLIEEIDLSSSRFGVYLPLLKLVGYFRLLLVLTVSEKMIKDVERSAWAFQKSPEIIILPLWRVKTANGNFCESLASFRKSTMM